MTRNRPAAKLRNMRVATKRARSRLRSKAKAKDKRSGMLHVKRQKNPRHRFKENERIAAPDVLSLALNHDATCNFLAQTSVKFMRQLNRRRHFSFKSITEMTPETALVMAASFDRMRLIARKEKIDPVDTRLWKPHIRQYLLQMGFADLLRFDKGLLGRSQVGDVIYFPVKCSITALDEKPKKLREVYLEVKAHVLANTGALEGALVNYLFEAFAEAVENAIEHAYNDDFVMTPDTYVKGGWWASGAYDKRRKRLFLSVYDQGVGIPTTISRKLLDKLVASDDGDLLLKAVEYGKTRTKKPGRGKGFQNMMSLIDLFQSGQLAVYSGRGGAIYSNKEWKKHVFDREIEGTLISWQVDLDTVLINMGHHD